MKIEKIVKPDQNIISLTATIPVEQLPELIGSSFIRLADYIRQEDADILSNPFVSYRNLQDDGSVNGEQIEIEIGFPVDRLIQSTAEFRSYVLPSYRAMSALYRGRLENLTAPYLEILARIREEKGIFLRISYEYYLTDEASGSDQHETFLELPYR